MNAEEVLKYLALMGPLAILGVVVLLYGLRGLAQRPKPAPKLQIAPGPVELTHEQSLVIQEAMQTVLDSDAGVVVNLDDCTIEKSATKPASSSGDMLVKDSCPRLNSRSAYGPSGPARGSAGVAMPVDEVNIRINGYVAHCKELDKAVAATQEEIKATALKQATDLLEKYKVEHQAEAVQRNVPLEVVEHEFVDNCMKMIAAAPNPAPTSADILRIKWPDPLRKTQ